ncbi:hypothetical protein G9A89_010898 [Geosiphon pyriformis]|nr:hypothetical protein G9A89_010898 [Geosiphon pyriformis]
MTSSNANMPIDITSRDIDMNQDHDHRPTRNKILVLGRRGVGKLSLIKQIIYSKDATTEKTEPSFTDLESDKSTSKINSGFHHNVLHEPEDPNHSGHIFPWLISTKYYTANVQFWVDETLSVDAIDAEVIKAYEAEENGIGSVVDAVIFVFRKDQPSTFNDIHPFLPFIARYEPAITLAVGMGLTLESSVGLTDYDDQFPDWCLENGFEYVDFEAKENLDEHESVGINRILEALKSHMWDGLTRINLPITSKTSRALLQDDDIKDVYELGHMDPKLNQELLEAISRLEINENNMDHIIQNRSDTGTLQDHFKAPFDDSDPEFFQDMPTQKEIAKIHEQLFGDFGHEDQDGEDGMDRILSRLNILREKGKLLPDLERRKLAASVAYSFGMGISGE